MIDEFVRAWAQLTGRLSGPMWLRFVLQPTVALALGIRAGIRDARTGQGPYLWALLTGADRRRALLRQGWKDVSRLFMVAAGIDSVYQVGVLHFFYPLQALTVAAVLAFVPYAAVRGLATRAAARRAGRVPANAPGPSSAISDVSPETMQPSGRR